MIAPATPDRPTQNTIAFHDAGRRDARATARSVYQDGVADTFFVGPRSLVTTFAAAAADAAAEKAKAAKAAALGNLRRHRVYADAPGMGGSR